MNIIKVVRPSKRCIEDVGILCSEIISSGVKMCGLDTETTIPRNYNSKTTVIQICILEKIDRINYDTDTILVKSIANSLNNRDITCYIFPIKHLFYACGGIPECLVKIIAGGGIIKIGCGLVQDAAELRRSYKLSMNHMIDLQCLVKSFGQKFSSLDNLSSAYLGTSKGEKVLGNYDGELSESQIIYGANDAYLPLEIYLKMVLQPINTKPDVNHNNLPLKTDPQAALIMKQIKMQDNDEYSTPKSSNKPHNTQQSKPIIKSNGNNFHSYSPSSENRQQVNISHNSFAKIDIAYNQRVNNLSNNTFHTFVQTLDRPSSANVQPNNISPDFEVQSCNYIQNLDRPSSANTSPDFKVQSYLFGENLDTPSNTNTQQNNTLPNSINGTVQSYNHTQNLDRPSSANTHQFNFTSKLKNANTLYGSNNSQPNYLNESNNVLHQQTYNSKYSDIYEDVYNREGNNYQSDNFVLGTKYVVEESPNIELNNDEINMIYDYISKSTFFNCKKGFRVNKIRNMLINEFRPIHMYKSEIRNTIIDKAIEKLVQDEKIYYDAHLKVYSPISNPITIWDTVYYLCAKNILPHGADRRALIKILNNCLPGLEPEINKLLDYFIEVQKIVDIDGKLFIA